ncbi:hypothetical protein JMUB6875_51510 [Nocardia sp. JMUB6875]|uniref:hypothetical protein n=1 Tax=Nocardia sp. JMUB6875 TaxID=3158170 RepID=UPI0032E7100C
MIRSVVTVASTVLAIAVIAVTGAQTATAGEIGDRQLDMALCDRKMEYTDEGLAAIDAAQKMYPTEMSDWPAEVARLELTDQRELTNETRRKVCAKPYEYQKKLANLEPEFAGKMKDEYKKGDALAQLPEKRKAAYEKAICEDLPRIKKRGGYVAGGIWDRCVNDHLLPA